MRRFNLIDTKNGEKVLAEGCLLSSGKVVIEWLGYAPSVVIWPELTFFLGVSVSGHDHEGKLSRRIEWWDE